MERRIALRLLFVPAFSLALFRAVFGGCCPASIDWDAAPEIARGMKYVHIALDEPRLMENFLVRIDLRTPGLRVASSGRAPNWGAVMDDYTNSVMLVDVRRQRTRDFLEERRAHGTNMVLAVNTSPWGPWRPPFTFKYGRFAHLTVSAGEVVSHNVTRGDMLVIFTNNVAVITNALDDALLPSVAAAHPGHGDNVILRRGVSTVRPRKPKSRPNLAPRTAIGISADGRWLYALVVDGRQPGYSMGAEMSDLVKLMLAAGAADAINMDGGGSATLAWWDAEKGKTVIPNRHGPRFFGYRPVAMNLGFYYEEAKMHRIKVKGSLDAMVGHVQGACASDDAIYLSHIAGIFKVDWNGNVIKHVPAERHTGDLCYHDGKVYSVLGMWGSGGKTKVCRLQVWDADLNLLSEKPLPELKGLDGVTVLDGILYHGVGYSSPVPRSSHALGRIDLKTMESLPQITFELPYQTRFCQQNLTTDGKLLYMTFYPVKGGGYALSSCEKDGTLVAHYGLHAGTGFERLPKRRFPGERPRFFKVNFRGGKQKDGTVKPPDVTLDFYELADGDLRVW